MRRARPWGEQTPRQPRKQPPEWIIWESLQLPEITWDWLDHYQLTYLDHTDDRLVLILRENPQFRNGADSKRWMDPDPTDATKEALAALRDIGFTSYVLVASLAEWATDGEFTRGRKWRTCRYATLMQQGNWCRACGGRPPEKVLHVDHIKPRSKHPELALDLSNLQVLCRDCNLGKGNSDEIDWRRPRIIAGKTNGTNPNPQAGDMAVPANNESQPLS